MYDFMTDAGVNGQGVQLTSGLRCEFLLLLFSLVSLVSTRAFGVERSHPILST